MKLHIYSFLLLLILQTLNIYAKENYKFRTLSPPGGFYYDGVKSTKQDSEGFIWVIMDNDLYRFDGYKYKRYYSYFTELNPYIEWTFHNIEVSPAGKLFINTNNGLYTYNRVLDNFDVIWEEKVDIVKIDNQNNIWVKKESKWSIFNINDKTLFTPLYDGQSPSYISNVFCVNNNDLYLFSNYGRIYRFNYSKKEFSLCMIMPDKDGLISYAKIYKGKLWLVIQKYGLYKVDLSTFTIEDHIDFFNENEGISIRSFHVDKKGHLWMGTMTGLYVFNPETKELDYYIQSESDKFSLPNNSVWSINEDRQKNIWIGTYSGALCYVNLDEKSVFKTYLPKENSLNHAPVSAFAEDNKHLWIGTEGGGINCLDKETGKFSYYVNEKEKNSLSHNNIKSLLIDKNHNLWAGTYTGGLNHYNTKTKQFKHYKYHKDSNSLLSNSIRKIIAEGDSGIWISYQIKKMAISFYSFKNDKFTHYNLDTESEERYIFDIIRSGENQLWVLTNKKLYQMDIKNNISNEIQRDDSTFMNFHNFCMDDSGTLWIGTNGNGLVNYNPNTNDFTLYDEIIKHNTFSIYSICYDNEGNLWLGTENGLFKYNISNNIFSRYDTKDGVQGQVYYPLASMKSTNGDLYFGGTNGFTVIKPKEISYNIHRPNIIISEFLIDHKPAKLNIFSNDSANTEKEIILDYNQTNFGFKFAADNYLIPEKNLFKYRLKGYDEQWREADAYNRTALYSKVPSGTYYFEVLASNNDGVWSSTPTVIKIKRKSAPWFSWYAYLIYLILLMYIAYLILRYYNEKKKLKLQLYLENVEREKKEEIHQSQLRFFTNISHDFRTPLSLIIAALEKLRQEGLKEYYYRILNSNAKRLLNLVNELMDFRTIENGKMKLEVQPVKINEFVEEVASDFIDYAQQRNIEFKVIKDPGVPIVYIDKNIIEKVIMNLLNNAFKYTKESGRIFIEIKANSNDFKPRFSTGHVVKGEEVPSSTFSIIVKDTGVGISKESISSVFERFYKVNTINFDSHLGTGIGLALVKSFVLLHKGKISIYSEREQGTEIEVCLPTDKTIYGENDFLINEKNEEDNSEDATENNETKNIDKLLEDEITQKPDKERKRILLAEDNEDLRKIIADFLSPDYEIIQAQDGLEASKLLSTRMIDFIISDIMMPKKDGITFSREVKSNIETSHIPLMLLTAKTSLDSKIEGADSGADFYFEKPVDLNLLKLSIQNIFKQQQQLKEYYAKNYFADDADLSSNERDNKFLKDFIDIIDKNIDHPDMDVNYIASELSMSRSKLYRKIKTMTDKSIVEFILSHRLRKAARLIIEEDMTMRQIMEEVGIESQPYFTNAFKKEFGETPSAFAAKYKKKKED